ncbi:MAG: methylated-DNA--[protein]-cysteine S-methyltransferase [Steroidobacteraceae bacterium]
MPKTRNPSRPRTAGADPRTAGADPRIARACELLAQRADEPWPLTRLARAVGLSPFHLQRRFKAEVGVSPKAFHAAQRVGEFKRRLRAGGRVTDALHAAGFSSTSRAYEAVDRRLGMTPLAYRGGGAGERISFAVGSTVQGPLLIAATDRGICSIQFGSDAGRLERLLRAEFPAAAIEPMPPGRRADFEAWMNHLDAHLEGREPRLDLPLDLRGTAFQVAVWRCLQQVPYGSVLSYAQLAQRLGRPSATRAVAGACARNRIALAVPCHRIVRGDGGLGGYRWGVQRKRALLAAEAGTARVGEGRVATRPSPQAA